MRKQIIDNMRMAGDYLRTKDEQYGNLLAELIVGKDGNRMSNNPILGGAQGITAMLAGAPVSRRATDLVQHSPTDPRMITLLGQAAEYGIPAAAAGIRYGLPAAGIGAIGSMFNNGYGQMNDINEIDQP